MAVNSRHIIEYTRPSGGDEVRVARAMSVLTTTALVDGRVDRMLGRLCDEAVDLLDVAGAGVLLFDPEGGATIAAASDELAFRAESRLVEDPRVADTATGPVLILDLRDPTRLHASSGGTDAGLCAVWTVPLRAGDTRLGTLDLYRDVVRSPSARDATIAQALADVAGALVAGVRGRDEERTRAAQLQHALDSRVLIEQAKGMLSVQLGVPVDEAFAILRAAARNRRIRLRDVAVEVVDRARALPSPAGGTVLRLERHGRRRPGGGA